MNICIGYVCKLENSDNRDVFAEGQKWGMLRSGISIEDGWYILRVQNSTKDKFGVARNVYENIGDRISDEVADELMQMCLKTHKGIELVLNKYNRLIPCRTREDTRFKMLQALMRMDDTFSIMSVYVNEMSVFISKICNIVRDRVMSDMIEESKKAKSEEKE